MDPGGFTPKLRSRLDHLHLRWGHQAVKLQNPIDAAFRDTEAGFVGDLTGQLSTAQIGVFMGILEHFGHFPVA